jgi:hypothetical protein
MDIDKMEQSGKRRHLHPDDWMCTRIKKSSTLWATIIIAGYTDDVGHKSF